MKRVTSTDEHFPDAILHSLHEALITIDLNDCILLMNTAAENLCGCSNADSAGKHISTVLGRIAAGSGEIVEKAASHAISRGSFNWESTGMILHAHGESPTAYSGTASPWHFQERTLMEQYCCSERQKSG